MHGSFTLIANYLSKLHYRFFCDKFVQWFIPRYIDEIWRCQKINEKGALQLLLNASSLKTILLETPVTAAAGRCTMPTAYSNYVMREVSKVEFLFRVLSTDDIDSLLASDEKSRRGLDIERILGLKATVGAEIGSSSGSESERDGGNYVSTVRQPNPPASQYQNDLRLQQSTNFGGQSAPSGGNAQQQANPVQQQQPNYDNAQLVQNQNQPQMSFPSAPKNPTQAMSNFAQDAKKKMFGAGAAMPTMGNMGNFMSSAFGSKNQKSSTNAQNNNQQGSQPNSQGRSQPQNPNFGQGADEDTL